MKEISTTFKLKSFKSSKDKGFGSVLSIYTKYFDSKSMTDTNEIIQWLDRDYKEFGDRFYCFGLIHDNEMIGYAQMAYFNSEKIIFVDYIAIDERHRRSDAFYVFVYKIKEFVDVQKLVFNYVLAEIVINSQTKEPNNDSKTLIRLLKMCGFGVIRTTYFQPRLGVNNKESDTNAILMVRSNVEENNIDFIKKETFLQFINTIYYHHYKRWYSIYVETQEEYESILKNGLAIIKNDLKKKKDLIPVNGYKHLFEPEKSRYSLESHSSTKRYIIYGMIGIGTTVIFTFLLVLIMSVFKIPLNTIIVLFILIFAAFLGILSVFMQNAYKIFNKFFNLFKISFHKLK
jgi:hypothetical protein